MSDPRAVVVHRIPATELRPGDLVNTSPGGEEDWQQVLGVFKKAADARSDEVRGLVESVGDRYLVVQLTDLVPVDGGVFFDSDGAALVYGDNAQYDQPVTEVASAEDGIRTYLYTKFELVTIREKSG